MDRRTKRAGRVTCGLFLATVLGVVASGCVVVPNQAAPYDFDGDRVADPYWINRTTGTWYDARTGAVVHTEPAWARGDWVVAGDYDGDKNVDPATVNLAGQWRTASGRGSFSFPPPDLSAKPSGWVSVGVVPVPGNYTDPARTQAAWYREFDATWFIEGHAPIQFGFGGTPGGDRDGFTDHDIAVPADYDGDGRTDLATYNHEAAVWRIRSSRTNAVTETNTGVSGIPVPADYDGDGKVDMAVVDGFATWHIIGSSSFDWEGGICYESAADFNGDGRADPSCFYFNYPTWWALGLASWTIDSSSSRSPVTMPDAIYVNVLRVHFYWICVREGWC